MPSIDRIELELSSQKTKLVIDKSDLDLQGKNKVTISEDGILYDRNDSNRSVERAAVHVTTPGCTYLKVTVSGLTESQKKGRLLLLSEKIESLGRQICGQWSPGHQTEESEPDTAVIHCSSIYQEYQDCPPDLFRGQLNWKLHMAEESDWWADREAPIDLGSTVLELYVLKHKLPKLFESDGALKIPLLLLRMFLGAALEQKVQSHFGWVSLVTRICHGSAEPFSGKDKDTAAHWLKYHTFSGDPSFGVTAYGGKFKLNQWLAAYRNWITKKVITCVNCYDQAAIVEVALSLGMDYNQVAWEYHQVFGYISRKTKLVGWGFCNNPYFYDDRDKMIVEDDDESRWAFRNHAHLSWGPDFHPEKEEEFYDKNKDPEKFTTTPIYIIDACAGPHVGNELRDIYYKQLDNNSGDTTKYPVEKLDELKRNNDTISVWNSGLTGLSSESKNPWTLKGAQDTYYDGKSIEWTALELPPGSPLLTKVYGGKLSTIQDQFAEIVQNVKFKTPLTSGEWIEVEIPDEEDEFGNIITEQKIYEDAAIARSYFSLRMTVTPSHNAAIELIKDRTMKFSLSSKEPTLKKQESKSTITMIGGRYLKLFTYANLMVELACLNGEKYLQDIADTVAERLSGDEAKLAEPDQWEACLN
ncbi:hypothetical protein BGZ80_003774 [Entomortierella chlamydospora]|uniref:Uncharacterized protein n=1 Tax=Entomortierella chlamydospora TaxID=101097 RepID=A0A9P6MN14_9FUNG|nr:hypothetical protein BGZ79_010630 [Entomortierella chlamydospora]KAG0008177.1 hypothetical protein BGZ80_003774 [Entomortierella chlamydospora]